MGTVIVRDPIRLVITPREVVIARLVSEGQTNQQIGDTLGASIHTIRSHVRALMAKLGLLNRAHLAAWYVEHKAELGL